MLSLFGFVKKNIEDQGKLADKYVNLPEGFKKLEYIAKTGAGYLDLKFIPTYKTRVQTKIMITSWFSDTTNRIMGADDYAGDSAFSFGITASSTGRLLYGYTLDHGGTHTGVTAKLNTLYEISLGRSGIVLNGTSYSTSNQISDSETIPFYLFRANTPPDLDNNTAKKEFNGRFYRTKIWDGSKLSMDLIPAYNESTKYYGMYDYLNGVFYPCSNKTVFSGK